MEANNQREQTIIATSIIVLYLCINETVCGVFGRNRDNNKCKEMPVNVLEEILGPSFNPRYMSIDEPVVISNAHSGSKRTTFNEIDFFVDESHLVELADVPAWEITNHVQIGHMISSNSRLKRQVNYLREWHCESRIIWRDLGLDYFPRYLRTVECTTDNCWFNLYKCKPRSFTVKILKRKRENCVIAEPGTRIGLSGLPKDLRELWVWEEHAVNFCCDCTL